MAFFLCKIRTMIFLAVTNTRILPHTSQFLCTIIEPPQNKDRVITSICHSLSEGLSWDSLSQKFRSVHFSNTVIEKILLKFKEPISAKQALNFFHWSAKHMHFQHGIPAYCITIHILVKAKLVKDAKALLESILRNPVDIKRIKSVQDASVTSAGFEEGKVFEVLSQHDPQMFHVLDSLLNSYEITDSTPFVFDLFMQICAKLRMIDNVIDACKILDERGFGLSVISYNTLLHVLQKSEKPYLVWGMYEHMIKKRMYPNEVTSRIMISALSKEGRLKRFLDMVERIQGKRCLSPGVVVNTCLIFGMIEEGKIKDGLVLLKRLLKNNMIIDTVSFSLVIFAKVEMRDLNAAWEVYEEMCKRGFEGNAFVSTVFIGAYCKAGRIKEAIGLMQEMENLGMKPFDETFNHLIERCSVTGYLEKSVNFCERMMQIGLLPSCLAFNKMVEMHSANGAVKRADEILTVLVDKGFIPDENTYSFLVTGYGKLGDVEGILKLYYEMKYRSLSPNYSIFCTLIVNLCQHGRVREADEYLTLMKDKSLVPLSYTYETFAASHLEKGDKTTASQLQEEMVQRG